MLQFGLGNRIDIEYNSREIITNSLDYLFYVKLVSEVKDHI